MEEKRKRWKRKKVRKQIELELDEKSFKARLKLENKTLKMEYALSKLEHDILTTGIQMSRRRKTSYIV